MVFLIDKYKISNLSDVICHKNIYGTLIENYNKSDTTNIDSNETIMSCQTEKELYNLMRNYINPLDTNFNTTNKKNKYNQLPNLLIYGPHGSGKKTLIKLLLEDIFNKDINVIKKVKYQITGYGNSSAEVEVEQSNYHLIIEPSNSGLDKYLIHEIVKDYAQQTILNINNCKTPFRIVLINNIDNLSYYAQTSLRCTMEKYHKTCKFILYGYQSSKIIEPLISRCLNIRVPCPKNKELLSILFDISCKDNIVISIKELNNIVVKADGNIKTGIWLLELYKSNIMNYELSWRNNLDNIVNIICDFEKKSSNATFNGSFIQKIRDILYIIFITNISGNQIIIELLNGLMNKCNNMDPVLVSVIITLFGYYETRINKGKRSIIHLESLINSIFYHILKFKISKEINN